MAEFMCHLSDDLAAVAKTTAALLPVVAGVDLTACAG
jgi:hypothetical protein